MQRIKEFLYLKKTESLGGGCVRQAVMIYVPHAWAMTDLFMVTVK